MPDHAARQSGPHRGRLLWRVLSLYIPLLVAILAVSGWFFFRSTQQALDTELSRRLISAAEVVASTVNPQYLLRIQPGDEGSTLYRLLLSDLKRIKAATHAKDVYIFDQRNRILLDADEEIPIGQEYLLLKLDQEELERVWKGGSAASTLYQGNDGKLYKSGYAPFRDARGRIVAAVGVEAGADFLDVIVKARRQMFFVGLLSAILIATASIALVRSIVVPLRSLVTAVESIGQREVYPKVEIQRADEIGYLGRRFNAMVDSLAEKDRLLTEMYQREKDRADVLQDEIRVKERLAALGELSAGIAHEIRNPLAALEGFTELLDRRVNDPNAKKLVQEILQEVKNLNRIVTQFLAFVREPRLKLVPTDLAALTRSVVEQVVSAGGRPGIRLETDFPMGLPSIQVDPDLLKSSILNLIQNAVEAMPDGGTMSVRLKTQDPWLLIAVQDSGHGIEPLNHRRIFDPFYTTKREGTGLGLAITHRIVQAHGGRITVESQPEKGSCFTLWLPIQREEP